MREASTLATPPTHQHLLRSLVSNAGSDVYTLSPCTQFITYCLDAQLLHSTDAWAWEGCTYIVSYTTHPLAPTHPSTPTQVNGIPCRTRCSHILTMHAIHHLCTYIYVHPQLLLSADVYPHTSHSNYQPPHTHTIYSHSLPQPKPPYYRWLLQYTRRIIILWLLCRNFPNESAHK